MVLESWYGSRRKIQEVSGAIPGNSQLGVAGITNFPRRQLWRSWRPGISPDTGGGWS